MSAPSDPSGRQSTWQRASTPPAGEPVFKTTLSHVDDKRTRLKAPKRTAPMSSKQRRRRRLFLFISEIVAFSAIILGLVAAYDIVSIQRQGNAPQIALQQFCSYEAHQDYEGAYGMVSPGYASLLSVDDFEALNNRRDQRYGTVTGCSQIQRDYTRAFGTSYAAFSVTVTTTRGTYHGTVQLELVGTNQSGGQISDVNRWTINQVTSDAHLDQ